MLLIADEIQSGLGRTGRTFACEHEGVVPDVYMLGKALGGGIVPVSAVVGRRDVLGVLQPGRARLHVRRQPAGLRGRPRGRRAAGDRRVTRARAADLGAAPARARLDALVGARRGRASAAAGLWAGVDIDPALGTGREVCERAAGPRRAGQGHPRHTIRLAPPLTITAEDLDLATDRLTDALR